MTLETSSEIEEILKARQDDGNSAPVANDGTYSAVVLDNAIDATGTLIELDTRGKRILDLSIDATDSADYVLEASPNGADWFGPFASWGGASQINETYQLGARYVRLRITTAAPGGATASGFMEVS
jgi:hypothetical protein